MEVVCTYEAPEDSVMHGLVNVFANGVPIGALFPQEPPMEQLAWTPEASVYNVKFQFRNKDTFIAVVKELKRYKDENGYKYLTIWTYNHGYAEVIDKEWLREVGFKNIPDKHPACMFLE